MRRPFHGSFPVTQTFGVNGAYYARFGLKGHNGVDYGLRDWTPVVAPHTGVVVEAGWSYGGYGYYVKIQNGVEGSVLAHLGRIQVWPGQWVHEGQQVALSDNTGNSTGSHLHWGYYRLPRNRANGYDGFVFQWPYLQAAGQGGGEDESETLENNPKATKSFIDKSITPDAQPDALPPEDDGPDDVLDPELEEELEEYDAKASATGVKDSFLTVLFTALGYAATEFLVWGADALELIEFPSEYAWVKPALAVFLGAIVKGIDRRKHEDSSPSTGLIKV